MQPQQQITTIPKSFAENSDTSFRGFQLQACRLLYYAELEVIPRG